VGESSWSAAQALSEASPAQVLRQLVDGRQVTRHLQCFICSRECVGTLKTVRLPNAICSSQRALCLRWLRLREVARNAPRIVDAQLLGLLVDADPPDLDTARQVRATQGLVANAKNLHNQNGFKAKFTKKG
jgi:hypothetical protein